MFRKLVICIALLVSVINGLLYLRAPIVGNAIAAPSQSSADSATGTCNNGHLFLSWNINPTAGTFSHWAIRIHDLTNPLNSNFPLPGDTKDDSVTNTSYTRDGVMGHSYIFWVHPVFQNSDHAYSFGNPVGSAAIRCGAPLTPPTNLTQQCDQATATFSWTNAPAATHYAIRVWDGNGTNGIVKQADDLATTSYQFTTTRGHVYYWWLHSIDSNGTYSDAVGSQTPCLGQQIPAPTNLQAQCQGNDMLFTWNAAVPGATEYTIEGEQADPKGIIGWTRGEWPYGQFLDFHVTGTSYLAQNVKGVTGMPYNWHVQATGGVAAFGQPISCGSITTSPTPTPTNSTPTFPGSSLLPTSTPSVTPTIPVEHNSIAQPTHSPIPTVTPTMPASSITPATVKNPNAI